MGLDGMSEKLRGIRTVLDYSWAEVAGGGGR